MMRFRPRTCSKVKSHSFLCVMQQLLISLHGCFDRFNLTETNSEQALMSRWEVF